MAPFSCYQTVLERMTEEKERGEANKKTFDCSPNQEEENEEVKFKSGKEKSSGVFLLGDMKTERWRRKYR